MTIKGDSILRNDKLEEVLIKSAQTPSGINYSTSAGGAAEGSQG
jgi:hypothetical protein